MSSLGAKLAAAVLPWISGGWDGEGTGPFPFVPRSWDEPLSAPPVLDWMRPAPGPRPSVSYRAQPGRPLVVGRSLFVGSAVADSLFQVDRVDGSLQASFAAGGPVLAEPIYEADSLVFCDTSGFAWSYALDGTLRWSHNLGSPCLSRPVTGPAREGVQQVFFSLVNNRVVSLDLASGNATWQYSHPPDLTRKSDLELFGAPSAVPQGDEVFMGFHDGRIVALDAATGESRWERRVGEGRYPDIIGTPLVAQGDVFVGGFSEPFAAVDTATRNIRWRLDVGTSSRATLSGGTLFIGGSDGVLRAVDPVTGTVRWEWDSTTSGSLTEPLVTPAGLLVGSSAGGLWLVDPSTGQELWTLEMDRLIVGISTTPVVDGRQVLVYTDAGNLLSLIVPGSAPEAAFSLDFSGSIPFGP